MIINDENCNAGNIQNPSDTSSDSSKGSRVSAAAVKVFGDILLDEGHSLCYSPSPRYRKKKLSNITNILNSQPNSITFENEKVNKPKQNKNLSVTSPKKKIGLKSPTTKMEYSKKDTRTEQSPKIKRKISHIRPAKRNNSNKHKMKTSPIKRTLAEKTQIAIDVATKSVNQSLSAARLAKKDHLKIVQEKTSEIREEWKSKKEEAAAFHAEAEKIKRENIDLRNQLSSQFSKLRAQRQRLQYKSKLAILQEEIEFNSNVYVSHKSKLKQMEDERRRKSIAIREMIRKEKRDAESQIRLQQFEEELAILEERHQSSIAWQEANKNLADQRRKSYAFRNAEGVRQRTEAEERSSQQRAEDHESYELKWAGERDADAYKKQCAQDRRDSFAFRNAEGVRHRAVMEELKALSLEKDHEDFILKWAGEDDAKAHIADQEEQRRQSLAFRNREGKRHRDLEEEARSAEVQKAHEEELLQAACQKDVDSYKASCAARDRASFQFRLKESRIQRLEAQNQHDNDYIENQKSRAIDDGAREDVKEYIKECKAKRRQSLAFRAKEKRRHAQWERKQYEKELRERSRNTHYASLDSRYMQLAKEKERAQVALDALRHAGCSFSTNPFAALLD